MSQYKFTIILTPQHEEMLDGLKDSLGASTRAEVIRKALAIAMFVAEVKSKGQNILVEQDGQIVEKVRLV